MAIDANDAPFSLHVVGETTDETWKGEFRAKKRLSHRDQLTKDQVRRELLGGAPGQPTERALSTSMILSELRVRLTVFPKWWSETGFGIDLDDDNVIFEMYTKALAIEQEALDAKKKKAEAVQAKLREEQAKKKAEDEAEDAFLAADAVAKSSK